MHKKKKKGYYCSTCTTIKSKIQSSIAPHHSFSLLIFPRRLGTKYYKQQKKKRKKKAIKQVNHPYLRIKRRFRYSPAHRRTSTTPLSFSWFFRQVKDNWTRLMEVVQRICVWNFELQPAGLVTVWKSRREVRDLGRLILFYFSLLLVFCVAVLVLEVETFRIFFFFFTFRRTAIVLLVIPFMGCTFINHLFRWLGFLVALKSYTPRHLFNVFLFYFLFTYS